MSAKTSSQPGRRTPLTLTGTGGGSRPQQQSNKNSSGSNGNSNSNVKNDNKSTNQKTEPIPFAEIKETMQKDTKKQQNVEKNVTENTKKPEKSIEKKTENGVGNKNHVNTKEKLQIGSEPNVNNPPKDKKEKQEKVEKTERAPNKEANKEKEDKREEKKEKAIEKKSEKIDKNKEKKPERETEKKAEKELKPKKTEVENKQDKIDEKMDVIVIEDILVTPTKIAVMATKLTPKENPASVTPKNMVEKNTTPVKATTTIEDVEMEPLTVEQSPAKEVVEMSLPINIAPDATSTPGKAFSSKRCTAATKSEIKLPIQSVNSGSPPDRNSCPRTFSAISGRRGIRPISDFTSSQFQNNSQFRESYRRINTELDVTSNTNTSLNVTVGSEIPNNSSFSFFGRGRKRDRTPHNSQSAIDLHTDAELSPPKRPRLEGFFNAVASPLSLLRSRFSKTTIQSSSTPVKLYSNLAAADDECEVQNVSGISIEEEIPNVDGEEPTATEEITVGNEAGLETPKKGSPIKEGSEIVSDNAEVQVDIKYGLEKSTYNVDAENTDDIKFTETPIGGAVSDPKNKKCSIM